MPPKTTRGTRKRTSTAANNQAAEEAPQQKRSKTTQEEEQGSSSSSHGPASYRIPHGPNGETFLPDFMPCECADVIKNIPIPSWWIRAIDATPDRGMTLGDRKWWEKHDSWLEQNKKKLKLKPEHWKMKETAMEKEVRVEEDEGKEDWDFVCLPSSYIDDEDEENEAENSPEEDEDEDATNDPEASAAKPSQSSKSKPWMKLASLHPDQKCIFTMLGNDRYRWWTQEFLKRNPDACDMYIYNDFADYGKLEVFGNLFAQYGKLVKRKADYRELWPELEGLALVVTSGLSDFMMVDDGERAEATIEQVGFMVVSMMEYLKEQNLLTPDSPIQNLGLVFAMLTKWGWQLIKGFPDMEPSLSWIFRIQQLAEESNIDLTGPSDSAQMVAELKTSMTPRRKSNKKWQGVKWLTKFKSYSSKYETGGLLPASPRGSSKGSYYDITQMKPADRKQYAFD